MTTQPVPQSRYDTTGAASAARDDDEFDTSTYECNICYEVATEPVVTMCGHLYCWPCLYRYARHICANYYICSILCTHTYVDAGGCKFRTSAKFVLSAKLV